MLRVVVDVKSRVDQSKERTAALAPIIHEQVSICINPRVQVTRAKLADSS
jgi:hypothetical protein